MYNILIVEDEQIMREGIEDILGQNSNFNIISAKNGKVALEIIEKNRIHGMILDIRMPQMTGLELLQELHERKICNIITIILSGHDEFDYAKQAMKYGVVDYILKPCTPEDIQRLGLQLLEKIEAEENKEREIEKLKEQIEKSKPVIRERFFIDLLNKRIDEQIYREKQKFLDIDFKGEYFQVAVIELDENCTYVELKSEHDYQIMVMAVSNIIRELIGNEENCEMFHLNTDLFVLLFNYETEKYTDRIYEILENAMTIVKGRLSVSLSAGVGEIVKGNEYIKASYNQAQHALRYKMLLGSGHIINIWDLEKSDNTPVGTFYEEEFIGKIKLNQKEEVISLLNSIFDNIRESQTSINLYSLNLLCIRIITACLIALEQSNAAVDNSYESKGISPFNEFFKLKSLEDIMGWTLAFVTDIMDKINGYRDKKSKSTIEQAKDLIYKNYKSDVALADLADMLHLSKNYFGQLFKDEMGMTVTEYVNMVRIKKAKGLLEKSSLKVYEVAFEVGFNDQHYFSSVFKKMVGVSPSEYRELL